MNFKQGE